MGRVKQSAGAKNRPGPTLGEKAALKSVLALLPPKLEPHLERLGLEVVDMALVSSGQRLTVRFTVDKVPGQAPGQALGQAGGDAGSGAEGVAGGKIGSAVTVADCAALSKIVSRLLDELDPGPGPEYSLEVSSPGLDRPLKTLADFERFEGSLVKAKLSLGGKAGRYTGRLANSPLRLITPGGDIPFTLESVISARLVPEI